MGCGWSGREGRHVFVTAGGNIHTVSSRSPYIAILLRISYKTIQNKIRVTWMVKFKKQKRFLNGTLLQVGFLISDPGNTQKTEEFC